MSDCCRQKWLAVVSLDPSEQFKEPKALRKLARLNKYEIKAVFWNPHMAMHQLMVSTVMLSTTFFFKGVKGNECFVCVAVSAKVGDLGCGCRETSTPTITKSTHPTSVVSRINWKMDDGGSLNFVVFFSDMSWSFTDPNLLSSCSTDTFIHIWDIR